MMECNDQMFLFKVINLVFSLVNYGRFSEKTGRNSDKIRKYPLKLEKMWHHICRITDVNLIKPHSTYVVHRGLHYFSARRPPKHCHCLVEAR